MIFDITITEKGGVGKTVVTALRAQHYLERGSRIIGVDTDPSNPGFSTYTGLPVQILPICEEGSNKIIPRKFDELVSMSETADADYMVVDVGTSNMLGLLDYFTENGTIELLGELGHEVRFHCVIRGASDLKETLGQFAALCEAWPEVPKVVWLNSQIGPIQYEGKSFEDLPVYSRYIGQIHGIIKIPFLDQTTFGADFARLLTRRETFAQALDLQASTWPIVERHRLKKIWKDLNDQMKQARL
ncbi:nucleotide-binding protein [Insolitispirillum peregrinum]|uniref:nucleotide-binding protein n=1 Tax=Insolitispirillum peregrinum TaxID=80876 RepID=UPI0036160A36